MDFFLRIFEFFVNRQQTEEIIDQRLDILEQRDTNNVEGLAPEDVEDPNDSGCEDNVASDTHTAIRAKYIGVTEYQEALESGVFCVFKHYVRVTISTNVVGTFRQLALCGECYYRHQLMVPYGSHEHMSSHFSTKLLPEEINKMKRGGKCAVCNTNLYIIMHPTCCYICNGKNFSVEM
ncbi:uncharacterized protein LOC115885528 [Sitophilus oryzae]|uniref:Uncharacterized protein LOC115885528 n=1 Tax=Sitophilus oryzae TaxID=7048 RepID=A0A6J2YBP6_SITOR|nr:uncharacterized protein LOC115885528 [Sitophilus oryzae]